MIGVETLNGRTVEKWQMTLSPPGQKSQKSIRWFDLQLNLAIREEYPGGYVRELKNIRVGPQPESLFSIPAGYSIFEQKQPLPTKRH